MIIPFFIMNRGCTHRCSFCNEQLTAGAHPDRIEAGVFGDTVRAFLASRQEHRSPVQIAFYGGTFTGMPWEEQSRLLELAAPFLADGEIDGIRLSTRPDQIDPARIALLRARGVTTVEVGAQSLDDAVLLRAQRGHGVSDIVRALRALREGGMETGIHLMAGLPGDSPECFAQTIEKTIALCPSTVRIHPTVVLKDTPLADAFRQGHYQPLSLPEAVRWCHGALKRLAVAGIPVIRLGLQTTRALETRGAVIAGPFHPAFRTLVESSLFKEMALSLLEAAREEGAPTAKASPLVFSLAPADLSGFYGHRRLNLLALQERTPRSAIRVQADPALLRRCLVLETGNRRLQTDWSGRIVVSARQL